MDAPVALAAAAAHGHQRGLAHQIDAQLFADRAAHLIAVQIREKLGQRRAKGRCIGHENAADIDRREVRDHALGILLIQETAGYQVRIGIAGSRAVSDNAQIHNHKGARKRQPPVFRAGLCSKTLRGRGRPTSEIITNL